MAVLLALGLVGAATVVGWSFVGHQPLPMGPAVVVPAVMVLALGEACVLGRVPRRGRYVAPRSYARALRTGVGPLCGVLAVAGAVAAGSGLLSMPVGGPRGALPGCPFPLGSHGRVLACVTRDVWVRAGLDQQRYAAGFVLAILALQLAVVLGPPQAGSRSAV